MEKAEVNLFHRINVEREIIPNKYQLIIKNFNDDYDCESSLKSKGNLSRNQEDQFIFFDFKGKSSFEFNIFNIIE